MNDPAQELPARFGEFYLFDLIGKGGMAEIFLSKTFTSLGTERLCVIKRILPLLSADVTFCEMLIQEAKLCARLSHANVVQTYDLGKIDDHYYIAMEYVEGFDLNQLLGLLSRARIALPLQFAIYVVIETLRGLDYAHRLRDADGRELGIIHRDVSPTNVLISTDGDVKLCDFGIAKVTMGQGADDAQMDERHLKGKVAYMAPEHVAGAEIDARADLFAAGILLWELLSGRRLYKTKSEDETLRRARAAEIPPLEDRGFPEYARLVKVVERALSRDAGDRFQTGQEFIAALEDYMHAAGMLVSQLRFAEFLMDNFGEDLQRQRRERERNLSASIDRLTLVYDDSFADNADAITKSLLTPPEDDDDYEEPASALEDARATGGSLTSEVDDHAEARSAEADEPDSLPAAAPAEPGGLSASADPERSATGGSSTSEIGGEVRSGEPPPGSVRLSVAGQRQSSGRSAGLWILGALLIGAAAAAVAYFLVFPD